MFELKSSATHAVASAKDPLEGGFIALAGVPNQPAELSRWTARDIQARRIKSDLIVLSACQTGMGQVHDAGVIGVGRAFYLAGIPQVIVSLWNVDDAATADLMEIFTKRLAHDNDYRFFPAEALRHAMLEARKRRINPVHWASFMNFGFPNVAWLNGTWINERSSVRRPCGSSDKRGIQEKGVCSRTRLAAQCRCVGACLAFVDTLT